MVGPLGRDASKPQAWRYLRHRVRGHRWQPFAFHSEPWNASHHLEISFSHLGDL